MRFKSIQSLELKNNSSQNIEKDIEGCLTRNILQSLQESKLVDIILEYLITEITIFESPIFINCIDMKIEDSGKMVFLKKENIIDESEYDNDTVEFFKIELFGKELSSTITKEYDRRNLLTTRSDLDSNDSMDVEEPEVEGDILFNNYTKELGTYLVTRIQDFEKLINTSYTIKLLKVSEDKFLITSREKLILFDSTLNNISVIYTISDYQNGCFTSINSYKSYFMLTIYPENFVLFGNYEDKSKCEMHDIKKFYKIPKGFELVMWDENCHKTNNKRFVTFECHISKTYGKKILTRFICHVDIQERKIKTKVITHEIKCMWTTGCDQVIILYTNGKIIQYFL